MIELTPEDLDLLIATAPRVRLKGSQQIGVVIATNNGTVTAWWGTMNCIPVIVDVDAADVEPVEAGG